MIGKILTFFLISFLISYNHLKAQWTRTKTWIYTWVITCTNSHMVFRYFTLYFTRFCFFYVWYFSCHFPSQFTFILLFFPSHGFFLWLSPDFFLLFLFVIFFLFFFFFYTRFTCFLLKCIFPDFYPFWCVFCTQLIYFHLIFNLFLKLLYTTLVNSCDDSCS